MAIPIPIIGGIIETIGGIFQSWQDRKKIEAQGKVAVAQAKIEGEVKKATTLVEGEIQWDNTAIEGMRFSWKDEWFAILLSCPFIMCFIPALQPYVETGFKILKDSTPDWYQYCFIGAIIASFGLRGFLNGWFNKKGV